MFLSITYIGIALLLVLANGFFVASEFSLVAARRSRIAVLAENGNTRAKVLLELIDNLNIYISACQLGITIASLGLGWIGEPAFASLLEAPLRERVSDTLRHTIAFALAFTVITFLHIVVGELAPKTMALERTERIALAIAWPMHLFYKLFRWPIRMLDWAGARTVRLFGLHPSSEHVSVYTVEELRHLIDISRQSGSIDKEEQKLLEGVFEFSDAEIREVMVPRSAVQALPVTATLEETKQVFRTWGYSRIPVYRDQLDGIVGILYRRDLEPYLEQAPAEDFDLEKLVRPPKFVPATIQISTALRQMQASRNHLAVVVDEYGAIEGIVTLEDLLEEIVGEIFDESDEAAHVKIVEDNGRYLLDGTLTVRDLNNRLKLNIPEEHSYTTVAGFMLAQAGRMMKVGESIDHEEGRFTVKSLDGLRIRRIRFTPALTTTSADDAALT
ncbi:MAG: HlyC/CorC family transporter [Desulfomonile tiedjei]|nr:HlyC/CorC family transporter [Desulfomonile tiedjei]